MIDLRLIDQPGRSNDGDSSQLNEKVPVTASPLRQATGVLLQP